MRAVLLPLVFGVVVAWGWEPILAEPQDALDHIRSEERWIRNAIQRGITRSPTFRRLVTTLNQSDLIVYIVHRTIARDHLGAYTVHDVMVRGDYRYVRIVIARQAGDVLTLGVIAHELQHAIEIAEAPDVGRTTAVKEFFARINGGDCLAGQCYETTAALDVQKIVMNELQGR